MLTNTNTKNHIFTFEMEKHNQKCLGENLKMLGIKCPFKGFSRKIKRYRYFRKIPNNDFLKSKLLFMNKKLYL